MRYFDTKIQDIGIRYNFNIQKKFFTLLHLYNYSSY